MPSSDDSDHDSTLGESALPRFFEGLEWPVPTAFAAALAAFRFEQGDVLFRDPKAYDVIEGEVRSATTAIQVLHPPRSARVAPADFDGDRRRTSWQSEVRVELVDLEAGTSVVRSISQGKLLMAIWRGDESWLEAGREEPAIPRGARELGRQLERARGAFDAMQKTKKGSRFLFVVDLASDASRVKAQAVEEALTPLGALEGIDLYPNAAGIEQAEDFHPLLLLRGLVVGGASAERVGQALRGALYSASEQSDRAPGEQPAADRFSVARHGLLDEIGG